MKKEDKKHGLKKVFIIGVNGFIGSHLAEELLRRKSYEVTGLDLFDNRISHVLEDSNLRFKKGDMYDNWDWIEENIKNSDVVVPLVAIAQPKFYIQEPLRVFELDFEANLKIIRMVVKHGKYLVFPSTSEVYGKVVEEYFNEDNTNLVVGPINQQRWIYSAIKQMLDRIIYAYGVKEGLKYCCFRPFNWVGPRLDSIKDSLNGSSRVVTSFFANLLFEKPIEIVGDGKQCRCFTDVSDGVECLILIIDNKEKCNGHIFNIGNPDNFLTIYELALKCIEVFKSHPRIPSMLKDKATYKFVSSEDYYGKGYDDVIHRRPSIEKALSILGWEPQIDISTSLKNSADYLFQQWKT